MQILRTFVLIGVAGFQLAPTANRVGPVLVESVVDGNTIVVQGLGRVHLLGIHAPAIGRAVDPDPIGASAKERLVSLAARRYVWLEYPHTAPQVDAARARRSSGPAYVVLEDGTFVNAVLAREGLARVTAGPSTGRHGELQEAEAAARAAERGLWDPLAIGRDLGGPPRVWELQEVSWR